MNLCDHARLTWDALKNWFVAQMQDSLAVGILWWTGLYFLHVPWAPLWAVLAALLQFIPHFGPAFGLIGPAITAAVKFMDWQHPLYVVMLYAGIVLLDGFFLQPWFMKRVAKVPVWASIVVPILAVIFLPFWGVLLAPPALAIIYAYRERLTRDQAATPEQAS